MILGALQLVSCQKDKVTDEKKDLEYYRNLWTEEAKQANVQVEHTTLEEVNTLMKHYGLDTFTVEDVERGRELEQRCNRTLVLYLGDFNNSGTTNSTDIVAMNQWRYYNNNYEWIDDVTAGSYPLEVNKFAFISNETSGTGPYELSIQDQNDLISTILCNICC